MDVYVEPISPEPTIIIFGTGHVCKALANAGKLAGFRIAVVDDRVKHANRDRFPGADVFHVGDWNAALKQVKPSSFSCLFIATREHASDLMCLRFALQSSAKYIGMLGSRKKARILFDALEKEGVEPSQFDRIVVPAGFDIGSETPEEIAASIVAELIAVYKNRDFRSMRDAIRRCNVQC
jgi:xanthine dehydrogenase accessory factor